MTSNPVDQAFWSAVDAKTGFGAPAVCAAIDRSGQHAVFSTLAYLHPSSGRWTPIGDGKRHVLGLADVGPTFQPENSLLIRPGYEAVCDAMKPAVQAVLSNPRMPAFAAQQTDPKKKGPDAWGTVQPDMNADDLARQNMEALMQGGQRREDLSPEPPPVVVDPVAEQAKARAAAEKSAQADLRPFVRSVTAFCEVLAHQLTQQLPHGRNSMVFDQLDDLRNQALAILGEDQNHADQDGDSAA